MPNLDASVKLYTHSRALTYQIRDDDVVGKQPSNDTEVTQGRNQETWQKVECSGGQEDVEEELEPGDGPTVCRLVFVLVQVREHGRGDKSRGPYHSAWSDKKTSGQACNGIAENLSGQSEKDLVDDSQALVVELLLFNDNLAGLERLQLAKSR